MENNKPKTIAQIRRRVTKELIKSIEQRQARELERVWSNIPNE